MAGVRIAVVLVSLGTLLASAQDAGPSFELLWATHFLIGDGVKLTLRVEEGSLRTDGDFKHVVCKALAGTDLRRWWKTPSKPRPLEYSEVAVVIYFGIDESVPRLEGIRPRNPQELEQLASRYLGLYRWNARSRRGALEIYGVWDSQGSLSKTTRTLELTPDQLCISDNR